jgi:tRNA(Arg) A34 adenosine deaminase TadA
MPPPAAQRSAAMRKAIELAIENVNAALGGPFGAVIARQGHVIASGVNQVTTTNDPTAHAEIVAIRLACRKEKTFELRGCELFTSCEPCPMCLSAAYWARVDRVWFACTRDDAAAGGFDDSLLYEEMALPVEGRRLPMKALLRKEGLRAFDAWRKSPVKIPY